MAKEALTQEEKDEAARVKAVEAQAERDRALEESRRDARERAARTQPSLIVHGPAQR